MEHKQSKKSYPAERKAIGSYIYHYSGPIMPSHVIDTELHRSYSETRLKQYKIYIVHKVFVPHHKTSQETVLCCHEQCGSCIFRQYCQLISIDIHDRSNYCNNSSDIKTIPHLQARFSRRRQTSVPPPTK